MSPLQRLARDLRDLIIDQVLLTPDESPKPLPNDQKDALPNPLSFESALLHLNHQLRAETLDDAARVKIPLVLDLPLLKDGLFQGTWLSRPFGHPKTWKEVSSMRIQVRLQPVDITPKLAHHLLLRTREGIVEGMGQHLSYAISKVICGVMDGRARCKDKDGHPMLPKDAIVNTTRSLDIQVTWAVDSAGAVIEAPPGSDETKWLVPGVNTLDIVNFITHVIDARFSSKDDFWPSCLNAQVEGWKPLAKLTHIGSCLLEFRGSTWFSGSNQELPSSLGTTILRDEILLTRGCVCVDSRCRRCDGNLERAENQSQEKGVGLARQRRTRSKA
ncbi:hypothetical protein EK21DRAFT_92961 [Setomelanomma holmii]|uniref:Uncharacterized protein n=1 Tax=Setomelanomma holmii TaxID=210430 RepID=A0A9P4H301_9PLEO|nr:hypothetical protein EK21DRAFT_92961 [Setomelanomma holmii]